MKAILVILLCCLPLCAKAGESVVFINGGFAIAATSSSPGTIEPQARALQTSLSQYGIPASVEVGYFAIPLSRTETVFGFACQRALSIASFPFALSRPTPEQYPTYLRNLGNRYNDFTASVLLHPSDCLVTSFGGSAAATVGYFTTQLANDLSELLKSGTSVTLVAFSQGNLFAEAAVALMYARGDIESIDKVRIVGIASVAFSAIGGQYINAAQDTVNYASSAVTSPFSLPPTVHLCVSDCTRTASLDELVGVGGSKDAHTLVNYLNDAIHTTEFREPVPKTIARYVSAIAVQPGAITTVIAGLSFPHVYAIDSDSLYFSTEANNTSLYRVPKFSTNLTAVPPPLVAPIPAEQRGISDIAFDASNLYLQIGGSFGSISRVPKATGDPAGRGASLVTAPVMLGVIGSDMYFWSGGGLISSINTLATDPATAQPLSSQGVVTNIRQKAIDASAVYYTGDGLHVQRFDIANAAVTPLINTTSEGNLFIDDASVYFSPTAPGTFGVYKVSKLGGPVTTLVPGTNGAIGYAVGGGFVYYVENSILWAISVAGGTTPINLAAAVDVHNMIYDNGMLYWGPVNGDKLYRLAVH